MNPRDYRIIGATEDDQEFFRCHANVISSGWNLRPVIVHKAQVAAYRKDRFVAYDLSVTAYMRASGARMRTEGRKVTAAEWITDFVQRAHGY